MINYGGGQSALYAYLASFFFRIFGSSLWSFRLVSVVISLISYYCYYKLVRRYKDKKFSILVLFLLTILPVYIIKARWGFDCYLLNPLLIISMYSYIVAIDKKKNFFYIISGILFGISFYTYVISYLIIPIFLIISVIYLYLKKKINLKNIISFFIPVFIFAFPLLLMILVNKGIIKNELVSNFISIPKMWFWRGGEISLNNIKNIPDSLKNIFIGNDLIYNSIPSYGVLYKISIPIVLGGIIYLIYKCIKKKYDLLDILMLILFIAIFIICICIEDLNINKANAIYIVFVYFIASFLECIYKSRVKFIFIIILTLYSINFISFTNYYFNKFTKEYEEVELFETSDLFNAIDYSESIRNEEDTIFLNVCESYIYVLLYFDIDPYEFNEKVIIDSNIGISSYEHYKYKFKELGDYYNKNYIYILMQDDDLRYSLTRRGFTMKEFNNYVVMYYED